MILNFATWLQKFRFNFVPLIKNLWHIIITHIATAATMSMLTSTNTSMVTNIIMSTVTSTTMNMVA